MSSIQTQFNPANEIADSLRAQKQEKESLQEQHEREISNLKHAYAAEKADLQDRYEASEQSEKLAHYDHLRSLKNQINRDEKNLETLGKAQLFGHAENLRHEEIQTEQEGRQKVENTRRKYAALDEYERQKLTLANDQAHQDHLRNTERVMKVTDEALQKLQEQKWNFLDQQKENHAQSLLEIQNHYDGIREAKSEALLNELEALDHRAEREINQKQLATGARIQKFESRMNDPFYQIKKFDSDLQDQGDHYSLQIRVPDHERKNLRIQAKPDEIQLIGIRTSEQAARENGKTYSSRSHQTLSEKFALTSPIQPQGIIRRDTPDFIEYVIPKLGSRMNSGTPRLLADGSGQENQAVTEIAFAETLPRPSILASRSGKGTVG